MPSQLGSLGVQAKADVRHDELKLAPQYYPLAHFEPQIHLGGKLAVITGASPANGRAIGEALTARGVDVIGTSRNPAAVPNPPSFPLLTLDIANPASVLAFIEALQAHPLFQLANGLPPSMVGDTYAQLLSMTDQEQNVVVGSPREPWATKGGNALIEQQLYAENQVSAVPFEFGR